MLKSFVLRFLMGQPAEQSRDEFKDVQEVEVLSNQNPRRNSAEKHFSECLSLKLKYFCHFLGEYFVSLILICVLYWQSQP